ncbi:MAG: VWA domain-containing protein [Phycisphaerae bacterium]
MDARKTLGRVVRPNSPVHAVSALLLAPALLLSLSCSASISLSGASVGGLGVTTGGQQDIAAARSTIEQGEIPPPESITVEGFLSEHSIDLEQPEDAGLLYAATAVAWNKDFDTFSPLATVQLGFGTLLDAETFERPSLNLCLVIDRSGSMGEFVDIRSDTTKLDAVKIAVDRLLAQLGGLDQVSIVVFNHASATILDAAAGNDLATIKSALDGIESGGGTDLVGGLQRGYRVADEHRNSIRSNRLIVFTDALLTTANKDRTTEFIDTMNQYAAEDIGATIFGVGVDFGHEVAFEISQVRGGNYFFLSDYERIVSVFDEEFDYLVTPVAYDVELTVAVPFEFDIEDIYGVPTSGPIGHTVDLSVPTLFLSGREGGGAILVRVRAGGFVDFTVDNTVAEIALAYTTPEGETETPPIVRAVLPAGLDPDAAESYFETEGSQRAVLLLNTALVLRNACNDVYQWGGFFIPAADRERAITRLTEFLPYFDALAAELEDRTSPTSRSLSDERALVEKLLDNILWAI